MENGFYSFDVSKFDWFVCDAANHYERSSPVVVTWLDALCDWLRDGSLTLKDLQMLNSLRENGIWLDPHGAGNVAYKQLSYRNQLPTNVTISY